ncbi:MAG TPA: alpha-(1-_3)-arabinofuranosyltransferase family protein [Solirubrobacteraceae bacterium]|nr:alpha-(1->3)-arabinofuranosyltransferase family protein [Solirubrobacteraceae bacterium]
MGLAFAQRPGKAVLDTRIELSADPGLFLHRVAAVWSSAGDLGHVQSGQFVGYLFPMAPWFAFAHWIGLPTWVGQRLWLGALIAVASWGVVRLMDELYSRRRGVAHLTAGVLYAANPYVAVWTTRGSVALLAYAAVPWLLLAAHRGMLQPRSWRWPALIGLVLACSGAGVNAGVVAWILPAPLALMLYEAAVAGRGWPALRAFGWRAGLCAAVGSAWWAVPLLIQSRYGTDFLSFTELPSSVWATPSLSESFRLLGYWPLYLGLGGTPVVGLASPYLFSAPVIVATLLVPVLAVGGLRWTRRWPYAPFFALLAVGALLAMSAGFPAGTPLRDGLTSAYYALEPLRFLRTSYKAAPLVGIALACLAGPALQALALKIRTAGLGRRWRLAMTGALALAAAAAAVLYGLPMFEGRAIDRSQAYGQIPVAWRSAIAGVQRVTPADRRIMLAPGALFGFYRWGNTVSSVGPALSERPLIVRELVPYADRRAAGLQATVDDLVQQGRLVPGQFAPLLQLMAVGEVVVNADGLPLQSGSLDPAGVSEALRSQRGFAQPQARYGPVARYPAAAGQAAERLPELRTYRVPGPVPGIVRISPVDGATVLDGNAEGIAELAAVGGLQPDRALFYAGDLDRSRLAGQVRRGARLVFTDSNRRRVLEADLLRANQGPTLDADDPLPREWPSLGLFRAPGSASETVARYSGLLSVRSPVDRGLSLLPEHRAFAAVDGRLQTSWLGGSVTSSSRRYLELHFDGARAIPALRLYPVGAAGLVAVSVNGGPERRFAVHRGWNALPLTAIGVRTLRVRLPGPGGPAGIAELRFPGSPVTESLRVPTRLADAARGLDLAHSGMAVVLQRTTADFPYRRPVARPDAEDAIDRIVTLPAARRFAVGGWASVSPAASDAALDRLAGIPAGWSFTSSGRSQEVPGRRASSAFDGRRSTAWIAPVVPHRRPWVAIHAPHPFTARRLTLVPGPHGYAVPVRLRVVASGGLGQDVSVGSRGVVDLPREVHTRDLRIVVLATRPTGTGAAAPPAFAVGEVAVRGLAPPRPDAGGTFASHCGALALRAGPSVATARVSGTIAALDAGRPLRLAGCGRRALLDLPTGASRVVAAPGVTVRADHLELDAPAPAPLPPPVTPGAVVRAGTEGDGSRDHVRLRLDKPAWLVYGESYSSAWRAWCRNAAGKEQSLGAPVPIDGFANGWRVGADCREARFAFAPQRLADAAYLISVVACVGMLLILLIPVLRRWRAGAVAGSAAPEAVPAAPDADRVQRAHPLIALACGLAAGGLGWLSFGARAGVLAGIAVCLLLVAGVSVRRLIATATVALVALPVLYLADPAPRPRGLAFTYSNHYITAHSVALVALLCLGGAAVLGAVRLRAANRRHATAASPDPVPHDAPAHQPNANDRPGDVGPAGRRLPRMPRS